jgi:hypothetical protein
MRCAGRIKAEDMLRLCFRDWVKSTGMALVTDPEKDPTLIESLLELKDTTTTVLDGPFSGTTSFGKVRTCLFFATRVSQGLFCPLQWATRIDNLLFGLGHHKTLVTCCPLS